VTGHDDDATQRTQPARPPLTPLAARARFAHDRRVSAREPSRLVYSSGAGGTIQDGAIEVQGDLRDRIRGLLLDKGFGVRG
jgi:hypothetical protein